MTVVETLRSALKAQPTVRLAVLFGSASTGRLHSRSDVDIGISLSGPRDSASAIGVVLERAVGRPVDLVLLDTAPPLLRFEIGRTGTVLIERDAHAWAEFRAHAMIDWWDWAPTARLVHEAMRARLIEEARRGQT